MSETEFPSDAEIIRVGDGQGRGGLYNMIFPGGFERGEILLPMLGGFTNFAELGRFRDIWIERDETGTLWFHLYTRNGGGNREDYAEAIARLQAHPLYQRDADDPSDATYASFWFRVPEELVNDFIVIAVDAIDTGQRWKDLATRLDNIRGKGDQ